MRAWPSVFVIALLAFGLGFVGGCGQAEQAEEAATQSIEQAAESTESTMEEHMVVDPVCGQQVAMADAVTYEHEGKTYYFCCEDCLNQFKEDPAAYMMMEEEMHEEEETGAS